jgi:hypothetical protein
LGKVEIDGKDDLDTREVRSFDKFWGWFATLVSLANEDITKIEEITKYPLVFVLNYLSYSKDINDIRRREQQKLQQQMKNR